MIETDEQRRWWFATHPEYSWSHKGGKDRREGEEKGEDDRVRPEDVDAYVDNALKYVDGPVADLLRSVKRNFGTEGDSQSGRQDQVIWADDSEDGWASLAMYQVDGGAFMPRLPTMEELFRLPREMAREFFRRLDALLQNNPLIIDPNALERHHGLPLEFIAYFLDCKLNVDDFIIIMRVSDHRLKPDGVHTGEGRGGDWNTEWGRYVEDNPLTYTPKDAKRVKKKFNEMVLKYGIDKRAVLLPKTFKRR